MEALEQLRNRLEACGQEHLLRFYDQLNEPEREKLLQDIAEIDFQAIPDLKARAHRAQEQLYEPISVCDLQDIAQNQARYEEAGIQLLRQGKLAVLILAGGEGTRLGFDHPKGMLDVGINRPLYLFEILVDNVRKAAQRAGRMIHLLIMTNPKKHGEVVDFFDQHDCFGYDRNYIHFFPQGLLPSLDFEGKVMLRAPGEIAASPDGNGNWYRAMKRHGLAQMLKEQGVEWINVVSVDNVLQQMADPVFLGATYLHGKDSGTKVVARASIEEKVGVICLHNGRASIVEYFEAEEEMRQINPDGSIRFRYGLMVNYLFTVAALESERMKALPIHLSKKKIPCCDEMGNPVQPEEVNGYKQEALITDLVELLDSCLPYEVDRMQEFFPIKNRVGVDSLETARQRLIEMGVQL